MSDIARAADRSTTVGKHQRRDRSLVTVLGMLALLSLTVSGLVAAGGVEPARANTNWFEVVNEHGELLNQKPLPKDEWTLKGGMFDGGGFHLSAWNAVHDDAFWERAVWVQVDTTRTVRLHGLAYTPVGGRDCSDAPFPFTSTSTTVDGLLIDTEACYRPGFNATVWPEPWPVRFEAFPTAEDVDGILYEFSGWEFLAPGGASCKEGNDSLTCTYDAWTADSKVRLVYATAETVDDVPPDVQLTTPYDGQRVALGDVVHADYTCTDDRAPSPSCAGTVANGAAIDTSSVGPKTFIVSAEDAAGNPTTKPVTYHVDYTFGGFSGPVDGDAVNRAKAGSTVPLQFHLADADGTPIEDLAAVTVTVEPLACDDVHSSAEEPLVDEADGRAGLRYLGGGDYVWTWATSRSYANSCREVAVEFDDGGSATAIFDFVR